MKKLRRPKQGRKLAGVCAALADGFGVDVAWVRVAWVVMTFIPPFATFGAVIAYGLLAVAIPEEKDYIDV